MKLVSPTWEVEVGQFSPLIFPTEPPFQKSFDGTGRRMTLFDGTLMAAIMDMETQNNNKDAAFVGMLKSKGRAKKWRKRASLKRNSGVVLDNDDANLEGK